MTRSKLMQIKALALLCILAAAIVPALANTTDPFSATNTGCVAYSGSPCSTISNNNGINLTTYWTCTYDANHQLVSGPAAVQKRTSFTQQCCNTPDAGTYPVANCPSDF